MKIISPLVFFQVMMSLNGLNSLTFSTHFFLNWKDIAQEGTENIKPKR